MTRGHRIKAVLRSAPAFGVVFSIFVAASALGDSLTAELSYPLDGSKVADLNQPFRWSPIPSAQAYILIIGGAAGQSDIWFSGDVAGPNVLAPKSLPTGRVLYARLWTKVSGVLRHSSDVSFTVVPATPPSSTHTKVVSGPPASALPWGAKAAMIFPSSGDPDVNFAQAFSWTTVIGGPTYRLQVGSSYGKADLFDSSAQSQTNVLLPALPAGSYYGRIVTSGAGRSQYQDFTFRSTGNPAATLTSPLNGSVLSSGTMFTWGSVPNATAYRLMLGTTLGGSNVADSGAITSTSYEVPTVPEGTFVYARLLTEKWGIWRTTDGVFSTPAPKFQSILVAPLDGATSVDTSLPFEWRVMPPARLYQLEIGTSPGAHDLHDSGAISVPKRFVGALPLGVSLYGRVSSQTTGAWTYVDFRFTVAANSTSADAVVSQALWATDFVRSMADDANIAFADTPLRDLLDSEGWPNAFCSDYASVLITMLEEMNIPQEKRILNICLKPNWYDCHTVVEFLEPVGGAWMILDPTFDLSVTRASDGRWASAEDLSSATRRKEFSAISYVFLGTRGDAVARSYYIDYPLLYLNVYPNGANMDPMGAISSLPYMDFVAMPVTEPGVYALEGASDGSAQANVDGSDRSVPCDPIDGLSYIFGATDIKSSSGPVYRPHRFVF